MEIFILSDFTHDIRHRADQCDARIVPIGKGIGASSMWFVIFSFTDVFDPVHGLGIGSVSREGFSVGACPFDTNNRG